MIAIYLKTVFLINITQTLNLNSTTNRIKLKKLIFRLMTMKIIKIKNK